MVALVAPLLHRHHREECPPKAWRLTLLLGYALPLLAFALVDRSRLEFFVYVSLAMSLVALSVHYVQQAVGLLSELRRGRVFDELLTTRTSLQELNWSLARYQTRSSLLRSLPFLCIALPFVHPPWALLLATLTNGACLVLCYLFGGLALAPRKPGQSLPPGVSAPHPPDLDPLVFRERLRQARHKWSLSRSFSLLTTAGLALTACYDPRGLTALWAWSLLLGALTTLDSVAGEMRAGTLSSLIQTATDEKEFINSWLRIAMRGRRLEFVLVMIVLPGLGGLLHLLAGLFGSLTGISLSATGRSRAQSLARITTMILKFGAAALMLWGVIQIPGVDLVVPDDWLVSVDAALAPLRPYSFSLSLLAALTLAGPLLYRRCLWTLASLWSGHVPRQDGQDMDAATLMRLGVALNLLCLALAAPRLLVRLSLQEMRFLCFELAGLIALWGLAGYLRPLLRGGLGRLTAATLGGTSGWLATLAWHHLSFLPYGPHQPLGDIDGFVLCLAGAALAVLLSGFEARKCHSPGDVARGFALAGLALMVTSAQGLMLLPRSNFEALKAERQTHWHRNHALEREMRRLRAEHTEVRIVSDFCGVYQVDEKAEAHRESAAALLGAAYQDREALFDEPYVVCGCGVPFLSPHWAQIRRRGKSLEEWEGFEPRELLYLRDTLDQEVDATSLPRLRPDLENFNQAVLTSVLRAVDSLDEPYPHTGPPILKRAWFYPPQYRRWLARAWLADYVTHRPCYEDPRGQAVPPMLTATLMERCREGYQAELRSFEQPTSQE
ncbi:MAG: hypothetical protein AB7S38_33080 [Vulcanimicrobiota bacterium]